jgi:hypothetical protein
MQFIYSRFSMLFLLENKHIVALIWHLHLFASLETAFLQVVNQVKSDMVREVFVWKQGRLIFDLYLQELH